MLAYSLRRYANIKTTLVVRLVFRVRRLGYNSTVVPSVFCLQTPSRQSCVTKQMLPTLKQHERQVHLTVEMPACSIVH